jgi:hypothetical protein
MNDADSVPLSVRAEARHLAAPDYAVLDGLIEHGGVFTSMKSMAMPGVPPGPRCADVAIGVAIRAATGGCRGPAPEHRPGGRVVVSYAGDGLFRESLSAVSARS